MPTLDPQVIEPNIGFSIQRHRILRIGVACRNNVCLTTAALSHRNARRTMACRNMGRVSFATRWHRV